MWKVNGYQRISKRSAEHRYNDGETIYLCPFLLRPGGPWHPEVAIAKANRADDAQYFTSSSDDFQKVVEEYVYYNCTYSVGQYPAYYIKKEGGHD